MRRWTPVLAMMLLALCQPALAQIKVKSSCSTDSNYTVNGGNPMTMDTKGNLCTSTAPSSFTPSSGLTFAATNVSGSQFTVSIADTKSPAGPTTKAPVLGKRRVLTPPQ